jgi:hypothetical protein
MNPIRLFSHLLNAVFVVALSLSVLTTATTANADERVSPASPVGYCTGCAAPASNTPCGGGLFCGAFTSCGSCNCVQDVDTGGVVCNPVV